MKAENLKTGTVLQSATESKTTRIVEDYKPADGRVFQQWFINNQWLTLAQIDARFRLLPKKKAKAV